MRIVLFLLAFICIQLNGQDKNKVALTAGSEFLNKNAAPPQSITSGTMMICPFDAITKPKDEFIAQLPQSVEVVSSRKTNPIVYLLIILLIGFAIHFFLSKKETTFTSQISFEEEEEQQRKKELWEAMAEPESGE